MKVGDKVELLELLDSETKLGISIGATGVITYASVYNRKDREDIEDVFFVKLNCDILVKTTDLNEDGTYQFYRYQLNVVEEKEGE